MASGWRLISLVPGLGDSERSRAAALSFSREADCARAAVLAGHRYVVFGGLDARAPADFPARVLPVFPYDPAGSSTFAQWPRSWRRWGPFCDAVLRGLRTAAEGEGEPARDALFLYRGHPAQITAAIRLGLALRGSCPISLNLHSLHVTYSGPPAPSAVGLRELLASTRALRARANVRLWVDSDGLAARVEEDTGERLPVLPFGCDSLTAVEEPAAGPPERPAILLLPTASPSGEKGYDLLLALAERLQRPGVEILAREVGETATEAFLPSLAARAGGFRTVPGFVPAADYRQLIASADLILLPYRRWRSPMRPSGVLGDAVLLGKPMVATADTWAGDQVERLGAGRTFADGDVEGFVQAVRSVLAHLAAHRQRLRQARPAWLAEGGWGKLLAAFLQASERAESRPANGSRHWQLARLWLATQVDRPVRQLTADARWRLHRWRQRLAGGPYGKLWFSLEPPMPRAFGRSDLDWLPTLHWRARGVAEIELRLDSPGGYPLVGGAPDGEAWPAHWLGDRRWVYLQEVSADRPLTHAHTLARVRYRCPAMWLDRYGMLARRPWWIPISYRWLRHHHSPRGLGRAVATGRRALARATEAARARWRALPRRARALADPATRPLLLARAWLALLRGVRRGCGGPAGRLELSPGTPTSSGVLDVRWQTAPGCAVEIRIGGPRGPLFAAGRGPGAALTGPWARPGLPFFLVAQPTRGAAAWLRLLDVHAAPGLPEPQPVRGRLQTGPPASAVQARTAVLRTQQRPLPGVLGSEDWGVCPPVSTGEVYLLGCICRAFLARHGGSRMVVIGPPSHLDILRLFPDAPLATIDAATVDLAELRARRCVGRAVFPDYGRVFSVAGDWVSRYTGGDWIGYTDVFLAELGLAQDAIRDPPRLAPEIAAASHGRFVAAALRPGRTIVLAPASRGSAPLPLRLWEALARALARRGFDVATNVASTEKAVAGTVPLRVPYSELFAAAEIGGTLISSRSGVCDLCSGAQTRLHIVQRSIPLTLPGVKLLTRLAENALPDRAVYHELAPGEPPRRLLERILDHPDLERPRR